MADEGTEQDQEQIEGADDGEQKLAGAAAMSTIKKQKKELAELRNAVGKMKADQEVERQRIEDESKSELDKLREQVQSLTTERATERETFERERGARERADHVRKAAGKFVDADEVVALLRGTGELDGIEDESDAKRIVDALAVDKPHLLKQDTTLTSFEQVLKNGELQTKSPSGENGVFTPADARSVVPFDTLNKMNAEQLAALQQRDRGLYERSMNALSGYDADGMKIIVQ